MSQKLAVCHIGKVHNMPMTTQVVVCHSQQTGEHHEVSLHSPVHISNPWNAVCWIDDETYSNHYSFCDKWMQIGFSESQQHKFKNNNDSHAKGSLWLMSSY